MHRRFTVDVKTSRPEHLRHLLVEEAKLLDGHGADIFVQARYLGGENAECVGWQWRPIVKDAPVRKWHPKGKPSHSLPVATIRPMSELIERVTRCESRAPTHEPASLTAVAQQREELHANRHESNNARVTGVDLMGLAGEKAFGAIWGVEPDYSPREQGDDGIDFIVWCWT